MHQRTSKGWKNSFIVQPHIGAEVESLCDRVSIIKEGKIIDTGTFAELRHLTRTSMAVDSFQPITGLESMAGVHNLVIDGNHTHLSVDAEKIDSVLKHLTHFGVQSIINTPPTLEELFLRYYGEGYTLDEEYAGK